MRPRCSRFRYTHPRTGAQVTIRRAVRVPRDQAFDLAIGKRVQFVRAGGARSVAMKIAEHETESVYRRSAVVSDADLQEAARKLAGTFPGTVSTAWLDSPSATAQNP